MAKFQKGQVANPAGRGVKPGPRREQRRRARLEKKATEEARKRLSSRLDFVLDKVDQAIAQGDMHAASIWVYSALGRPRPESPRVAIPGLDQDCETAATAIMLALSRAEISAEHAETLFKILEARGRLSFSANTLSKLAKIKELLRARGAHALADNLSLPILRQQVESVT